MSDMCRQKLLHFLHTSDISSTIKITTFIYAICVQTLQCYEIRAAKLQKIGMISAV